MVQEQGEKSKPRSPLTRDMIERLPQLMGEGHLTIITPEVFDRFPKLLEDKDFIKWAQTFSLQEREHIVDELCELEMESMEISQDRREKLRTAPLI